MYMYMYMYLYLLKTELRISHFQHFHWLAGHRLSAHIPALPNMVNFFLSVFSKGAFVPLTFFFRFSIIRRRVFNKTIILLGLAGYEMIITNSALRASLVIYHFISSAPS